MARGTRSRKQTTNPFWPSSIWIQRSGRPRSARCSSPSSRCQITRVCALSNRFRSRRPGWGRQGRRFWMQNWTKFLPVRISCRTANSIRWIGRSQRAIRWSECHGTWRRAAWLTCTFLRICRSTSQRAMSCIRLMRSRRCKRSDSRTSATTRTTTLRSRSTMRAPRTVPTLRLAHTASRSCCTKAWPETTRKVRAVCSRGMQTAGDSTGTQTLPCRRTWSRSKSKDWGREVRSWTKQSVHRRWTRSCTRLRCLSNDKSERSLSNFYNYRTNLTNFIEIILTTVFDVNINSKLSCHSYNWILKLKPSFIKSIIIKETSWFQDSWVLHHPSQAKSE